jgi:hypothetical protein
LQRFEGRLRLARSFLPSIKLIALPHSSRQAQTNGFLSGDTQGVLKGTLQGGAAIIGTDLVRSVK